MLLNISIGLQIGALCKAPGFKGLGFLFVSACPLRAFELWRFVFEFHGLKFKVGL